jgi:hypothetical protein
MSFLLSLMFSLQQNWIAKGRTGWTEPVEGGGGDGGLNNVYTCDTCD